MATQTKPKGENTHPKAPVEFYDHQRKSKGTTTNVGWENIKHETFAPEGQGSKRFMRYTKGAGKTLVPAPKPKKEAED